MTNGRDIHFLDAGQADKHLVSAFFSPTDLEKLLFIRQNRQSLSNVAINSTITDRLYQQEGACRICEAFELHRTCVLIRPEIFSSSQTATLQYSRRSKRASQNLFLTSHVNVSFRRKSI
jgi:hypothetical protein